MTPIAITDGNTQHTKTMIKIGLLGCGRVSQEHLRSINECEKLQLTTVYDPNIEHARDAAEKFSAPHYTDSTNEFYAQNLDAVSITSPAPYHIDNVRDAAKHKCAVLCEKPLAMNAKDARTIVSIMQEAGLPLYTGFCYRFSGAAQKIKELVQQEAVGDIQSLRLIYIWDVHGKYEIVDGKKVIQKRREGRMLEGGPMVDCGTHQIDLARWWMQSEIAEYKGFGAWVEKEYEAPDHMWVHMTHENGIHTMVEISYSYCHTAAEPRALFLYELIGSEGVIHYSQRENIFTVYTSKETLHIEPTDAKDFTGMYNAFAHALKTGDKGDLATGEDGVRAIEIARTATEDVIRRRIKPRQTI